VLGFIVAALALIVAEPRLDDWLVGRRVRRSARRGRLTEGAVFGSGVYGGYFGAAQGIMLLAILGLAIDDELQRINALKVALAGLVNFIAGVIFAIAATVAWLPALLIALGSIVGGLLGARFGRRLPAAGLRAVIVTVGVLAIVRLLT
jgi:uncharacterized membrane protein YfcA